MATPGQHGDFRTTILMLILITTVSTTTQTMRAPAHRYSSTLLLRRGICCPLVLSLVNLYTVYFVLHTFNSVLVYCWIIASSNSPPALTANSAVCSCADGQGKSHSSVVSVAITVNIVRGIGLDIETLGSQYRRTLTSSCWGSNHTIGIGIVVFWYCPL